MRSETILVPVSTPRVPVTLPDHLIVVAQHPARPHQAQPPRAAPATGISILHEQQQKNLVTAALQGVPPEETSRQTMRLPAAQTRTGS